MGRWSVEESDETSASNILKSINIAGFSEQGEATRLLPPTLLYWPPVRQRWRNIAPSLRQQHSRVESWMSTTTGKPLIRVASRQGKKKGGVNNVFAGSFFFFFFYSLSLSLSVRCRAQTRLYRRSQLKDVEVNGGAGFRRFNDLTPIHSKEDHRNSGESFLGGQETLHLHTSAICFPSHSETRMKKKTGIYSPNIFW